ncbi:discoidin domain-containing receptor 2-like isoform X2 [Rhopilema esculentum]
MFFFGSILAVCLFTRLDQVASNYCNHSLGMSDRRITDSQIKTMGDGGGQTGKDARLKNGTGWCNLADISSSKPVFKENVYLEVNLRNITKITGFSLTGGSGKVKVYTTGNFIQLFYKMNKYDKYILNKKIQVFNLKYPDTRFIAVQPPIHGRYLKYMPENDQNPKCVQLEFYGCQLEKSGCFRPLLNNKMGYTASSSKVPFAPNYINMNAGPFPWGPQFGGFSKEYVEIELKDLYLVSGVRTFPPLYADNMLDQPIAFSIHYKLSNASFYPYTARYTQPYQFNTTKTLGDVFKIEPIFAARVIKIFPNISKDSKHRYLKMEIYGCKLSDQSIFGKGNTPLPSVSTTLSRTTPVGSTMSPEAEIQSYEIRQGNRFRDLSYVGKASRGTLHDGKGSLVDGKPSLKSPIKHPEYWVGWKRSELPRPYIILNLERPASLRSLGLFSYVDRRETLGSFIASQVQFGIEASGSWSKQFYACPERQESDGSVFFNIHFKGRMATRIKIQFNYSDEYLVFSEVIINAEKTTGEILLRLSEISCKVAIFEEQLKNGDSNSRKLIFIVVSVAVVTLLAFLLCLAYVYRKKIRQKVGGRKNRKNRNTAKGINGNNIENDLLLQSLTKNPIYDESFTSPNIEADHMYAVVEGKGSEKSKLMEPNVTVEEINDSSNIYAAPDQGGVGYAEIFVDQEKEAESYAEPDSPHDKKNVEMNPIYEGTRIYEDPYQTVTGSSLYADPDVEPQRKSIEIRKFPRDRLRFLEKIGTGQFGEVHICEVESLGNIVGSQVGHCSWVMSGTIKVAVKLLKAGVDKNIEKEFMKEVRVMARLQHDNVVQLLGICEEEPKCMVVEYMENGDLNQFLHNYSFSNEASGLDDIPSNILNEETLLYMCMQIASGMHYLSSQGFIHRDLATRNCLVGHSFTVKVSDFGMSRYLYSKQYYRIEGKAVLPIRWMAPESLFYGTFTSQSDIWSFAVTVWEMFTFARETPYSHLSDQQVIENACSVVAKQRRSFRYLPKPDGCPSNVYEMMQRCWERSPSERPTFTDLFQFFQSIVNSTEASV